MGPQLCYQFPGRHYSLCEVLPLTALHAHHFDPSRLGLLPSLVSFHQVRQQAIPSRQGLTSHCSQVDSQAPLLTHSGQSCSSDLHGDRLLGQRHLCSTRPCWTSWWWPPLDSQRVFRAFWRCWAVLRTSGSRDISLCADAPWSLASRGLCLDLWPLSSSLNCLGRCRTL